MYFVTFTYIIIYLYKTKQSRIKYKNINGYEIKYILLYNIFLIVFMPKTF